MVPEHGIPAAGTIAGQNLRGVRGQKRDSPLPALAFRQIHQSRGEVEVRFHKACRFGDPEPGGVEKLGDDVDPVAPKAGRKGGRLIEAGKV